MQRTNSKFLLAVGTLALCGAPALAAPFSFDGDLVEHHTFDTDVSDAFGRTSTAVGGASIDNANFAMGTGSLALDGTTGLVDLGAKAGLNAMSTFTMSVWVDADTNSQFNSIYSSDGWGGNHLHLNLLTQTTTVPSPAIQAASPQIPDQLQWLEGTVASAPAGWVHVAVVADGANVDLYVDGALVDSTSTLANALDLGLDTQVGAYQGSRFFDGNIDDLRIYNVALTGSQIAEVAGVPEPGSLALLGLGGLMIARRRRA